MKNYLLFVVFLFVYTCAFAQEHRLSVKGGANITWIGGDATNVQPALGYHIGLLTNTPIIQKRLFLQPEFYFSRQGANGQNDEKAVYHYFCLPALLKIDQPNYYFLFGPQVGLLYNAKMKIEDTKENVINRLNPVDLMLIVGVGFKVDSHINLEVRYHHGVSDTAANEDGNYPNRVIQFSLTHSLLR